MTDSEFASKRALVNAGMEALLQSLTQKIGGDLRLMPMHSFSVGGDDRVFNRRLARHLIQKGLSADCVEVWRLPASPQDIIRSMQQAAICICMRFHSVVFAETLGVPFVAIDYTQGGKIHAYLEARGKLDFLLTLDDLCSGAWRERVSSMNLVRA